MFLCSCASFVCKGSWLVAESTAMLRLIKNNVNAGDNSIDAAVNLRD